MVFWKKEPLGGTRLCPGGAACSSFPACLSPSVPGNHKVKEAYGPSSSITHPHAMTCTECDLWNFPRKTTAFNYSVSNYIIDRENVQRNNLVAQCQLPEIHFQRQCWKSLALSFSEEFRLLSHQVIRVWMFRSEEEEFQMNREQKESLGHWWRPGEWKEWLNIPYWAFPTDPTFEVWIA